MSNKTLIGHVCFTVQENTIVNQARDMVLSGEWQKAIKFLRDCLIGFTVEHAFQVLSGESKLDNENYLVKDEDSADYIRETKEVYLMDLFYEHGTLYKFDRKVTSSEFKEMMHRYHYKFDATFTPEVQLQAVERYLSYAKNEKVFRINSVEYIVAVPVDPNCYPMWFGRSDFNNSHLEFYRNYYGIEPVNVENVKPVETKEVSEEEKKEKSKFVNNLVKQQNQSYMEGVAQDMDTSIETLSNELKEKVKQACKDRNVTWENVTVFDKSDGDKEKTLSVPKELVIGYLSRDPAEWKPICESGLKMYNDSAWHSDLWLAMGHDLSSDAYDMDNAETSMFYQAIDHYRMMKLNKLSDFSTLNDVKMSSFEGRLVYEDSKNITDRDILVLPNAGLKYEGIARKAGMVITETGGQISHLVIVGKEEMFPVILMKDAIRKLKSQYSIKVDFENQKIIGTYY